MPRVPRLVPAAVPVHLVQRGNNRGPCFVDPGDYQVYLLYLHDAAMRFGCEVHAYVLMTNHVHLLVTPRHERAVSRMMQHLGRRYVRKFNELHGRTGTLWEGRFRSSIVDSERYLIACHRYIEQNPMRAGLVRDPIEYVWSSYRHYAEGIVDPLLVPPEWMERPAGSSDQRRAAHRALIAANLDSPDLQHIRTTINKGQPLCSESVAQNLEMEMRARIRRARTRTHAFTQANLCHDAPQPLESTREPLL